VVPLRRIIERPSCRSTEDIVRCSGVALMRLTDGHFSQYFLDCFRLGGWLIESYCEAAGSHLSLSLTAIFFARARSKISVQSQNLIRSTFHLFLLYLLSDFFRRTPTSPSGTCLLSFCTPSKSTASHIMHARPSRAEFFWSVSRYLHVHVERIL